MQQSSLKFQEQAAVCSLEQEKVSTACATVRSNLKIAREQNGRQRAEELRSGTTGVDGAPSVSDVYRRYGEVTTQLTAQVDASSYMAELTMQILDDKQQCFSFHQVFNEQFSAEMQAAFASYNPNSSGNTNISSLNDSRGTLNPADRSAAISGAGKLVSGAATYKMKIKYGRDLAAYLSRNFGRKSWISSGARKIASTVVTTSGLLWSTATAYFSVVSPAGNVCDMIKSHEDPLQAESLGCTPGIKLNRG